MSLALNSKLGPYEIVAPLGVGGMGEVYRAKDTRLDREVAIKVLPPHLSRSPEFKQRLEREAKTISQLTHPHICTLYDVGHHDGADFLVMELLEGETLAQRLSKGPLPQEQVLRSGVEITMALDAAHRKGVVHRDLKPGNIMLTKSGAKLLDFGLAKSATVMDNDPSAVTVSQPLTSKGTILGTFQYMAPEQLEGVEADARTDIFAFGAVLYEMATGRRAFEGKSRASLIAAIMSSQPRPISELQPMTPPALDHLVRSCLSKDPDERVQTAHDVKLQLQWIAEATSTVRGPAAERSRKRRREAVSWLLCGLLAIIATILLARDSDTRPALIGGRVKKSALTVPPNTSINWRGTRDSWSALGFSQLLAISRDGRRMIVTLQEGGHTCLYLKEDDSFLLGKITGAEGARGGFLSPDAHWVAFVSGQTMYKVRLPGGAAQPICEVNSPAFDGTWLDDGTIVYSTDLGLRQVSANGGASRPLTSIDVENGIRGHHFPHVIPGTQWIVFTVTTETGQHAGLLSLDEGTWSVVKQHATNARYVAGGYLVFARGGDVLVSPYDPSRPMTVGTESPMVRGVHTVPGLGGALVHVFATSDTGVLAYAPQADPPEPDALLWVDHDGKEQEIVRGPGHWMHQRLSPSGDRILFNRLTSDGMLDLYIYDVQRDQINPLTRNGNAYDAEWSPDGRAVGFAALDNKGRSVYLIPADFSGPIRKIIDGSDSRPHFSQWTDDGSTFVFFDRSKRGGIWTTSAVGGEPMRELMNSPLGEGWARISPDGRLIAYVGWESARADVHVQAYPDLGPRIRVSKDGGREPRWAHDSRTLFFREAGKIFKAAIVTEPNLDATTVVTLPINDVYDFAASGHQHYDLSLDGKKFLMVKHGRGYYPDTVHIIEHWPATLSRDSTQ